MKQIQKYIFFIYNIENEVEISTILNYNLIMNSPVYACHQFSVACSYFYYKLGIILNFNLNLILLYRIDVK